MQRLVRHPGNGVEQCGVARAGPHELSLAHLANDVVVDARNDFRPELGLGHVCVDIDQKIIFVAFRLLGRVRENVAGIGL